MKKVCILGGSFNPPTLGHIELAEFLLGNNFDEVWITPCYDHMFGKNLESSTDRIKMCEIASRKNEKIKIFDYEIKNKLSGSTYDLVRSLTNDELDADITFAIGQDNANSIDKWHKSNELLKIAKFVVITRVGINSKSNWYNKFPHIHLDANGKVSGTSSTEAKEYIYKHGRSANNPMLDDEVLGYIRENFLYLSEEERRHISNESQTIINLFKKIKSLTN